MARKKLMKQFYELKTKEIMDTRHWDLPLVEKDSPIEHVLTILLGKKHCWVVDTLENKKLIGIITEKDFLAILAPLQPASYSFGFPNLKSLQYGTAEKAADLMTTKLVTCSLDSTVREVVSKMVGYKIRRVPITQGDQIMGEITLSTLLRKYRDALSYRDIKRR